MKMRKEERLSVSEQQAFDYVQYLDLVNKPCPYIESCPPEGLELEGSIKCCVFCICSRGLTDSELQKISE